MVENRPSRSEKGRKNNKYQSDLATIRLCRNLLCRWAIPSKLWQSGLTIRASTSWSRFSLLSSDRFALWFNTLLSNTYFFFNIYLFAVFKFKLVIDIKLNAIVRHLVERALFNSEALFVPLLCVAPFKLAFFFMLRLLVPFLWQLGRFPPLLNEQRIGYYRLEANKELFAESYGQASQSHCSY